MLDEWSATVSAAGQTFSTALHMYFYCELPAGHSSHDCCALTGWMVPLAHTSPVTMLADGQLCPFSQSRQADCAEAD